MKMGWRWYGEGNDPVSLGGIKQMPGEIWTEEEMKKEVDLIHSSGFDAEVVESVNVHDDIKIGLPTQDALIENYNTCMVSNGSLLTKISFPASKKQPRKLVTACVPCVMLCACPESCCTPRK